MPILSRRDFLRVSATGIIGAGLMTATVNAAEAFSFATINDTHIKDVSSVELLNEAVSLINKDARIKFTCVLGDMATGGQLEELALSKTALDKLEKPYYVVPGNHDVFLRASDVYANYVTTFGPVHWTYEQNGWSFIGFSSCEGVKSDVTVSSEELMWLQESLKKIDPKQPIALFCHHPLNPHSKAYRVLNADDILALFANHNLKIAVAGHWHGNQTEEQNGVLFATTACCASTRGNFDETPEKGYRLFHIQDNAVETEFVVVSA